MIADKPAFIDSPAYHDLKDIVRIMSLLPHVSDVAMIEKKVLLLQLLITLSTRIRST
jgi:hypothetical protein